MAAAAVVVAAAAGVAVLGLELRRALHALDAVRVAGASMEPGLRAGDLLLVRPGAPVRVGDVVVVRRPDRPQLLVVKRAVARSGERWDVRGDHPAASTDSRHWGPVPADAVVARVVLRYWPPRWPGRRRARYRSRSASSA